jgi:hypothetical protein
MSSSHYETPERLWDGKGPSRNKDGSPRRDSTQSESAHLSGVGRILSTMHAAAPHSAA